MMFFNKKKFVFFFQKIEFQKRAIFKDFLPLKLLYFILNLLETLWTICFVLFFVFSKQHSSLKTIENTRLRLDYPRAY